MASVESIALAALGALLLSLAVHMGWAVYAGVYVAGVVTGVLVLLVLQRAPVGQATTLEANSSRQPHIRKG